MPRATISGVNGTIARRYFRRGGVGRMLLPDRRDREGKPARFATPNDLVRLVLDCDRTLTY